MDIDGKNLKKLVTGDTELQYPTWSPKENFIAYLSYGIVNDYRTSYQKITFFNLSLKSKTVINTVGVLPPWKYIPNREP